MRLSFIDFDVEVDIFQISYFKFDFKPFDSIHFHSTFNFKPFDSLKFRSTFNFKPFDSRHFRFTIQFFTQRLNKMGKMYKRCSNFDASPTPNFNRQTGF